MNVDHLLARARRTIRGKNKPRQTDLRRRVSDTYYAMFHTLYLLCADALVGRTKRNSFAWVVVYRSLEHKFTKDQLDKQTTQALDVKIKAFAILFVTMQERRHTADYDPRPFADGLHKVQSYVDEAELAISDLESLDSDRKTELACLILLKFRK